MLPKRLLIIEDDYDVAEMLLMYFTSHKYEVYHADNGADGIELARKKFPNLILLDVMLPEMNGYEICSHLRSIALTKHIPVIFLTQKDGRADKVEGLELGADDYIPKPFDVDELRLRVQRSIDRATRESLHERRTGLPTGPMVREEFERVISDNMQYNEYWFDLAGFNVFTDAYGFMAAEQVMGFTAKIIRDVVSECGTENDFIGIYEDHFVIITYASDNETLLKTLNDKFNQGSRVFYTFMDVERGGILINEGQSDEEVVPLMYLRQVAEPSGIQP